MTQKKSIQSIALRFIKTIGFILVVLWFMIFFLNHGLKSYFGFQRLSKTSVESIIIYKFDINKKADHNQDSMILSKDQIDKFVSKWNNSYLVGPSKFIPSFTLIVKMPNGFKRNFRIGEKNIKENNDWSYRFLFDDCFFESIWNKK